MSDNLWGSPPFKVKYEMIGMDGPDRYFIVDTYNEFIADFGGVWVGRSSHKEDHIHNLRAKRRAEAFCGLLNLLQEKL